MKKLAIIGSLITMVAVSLVVVPATSAKSSGIPPAQLHALMLRKSVDDQQLTLERGANERFTVGNQLRTAINPPHGIEVGGGISPISPQFVNERPRIGIEAVTLERGLNERFASDNPVKQDLVGTTPSPSTGSPDFQWSDAGIGAGALLGAMALLGTCLVLVRNRGHHLKTS